MLPTSVASRRVVSVATSRSSAAARSLSTHSISPCRPSALRSTVVSSLPKARSSITSLLKSNANAARFLPVFVFQHESNIRSYSSKSFPPHIVISMPALSPTMTQGNLGAWKKQIGDELAAGDILVEIETDKAQMEFENQEEGFLAKILVEEGAKDIPVGKPIAIMVDDAADVEKFANFTVEDSAPKSATPSISPSSQSSATTTASSPSVSASPTSSSPAPPSSSVKSDVEKAKSAPKPKPAASAPATSPSTTSAQFVDIPVSNMRQVIATRLLESKTTIPHYYLTSEINMDRVLKLREVLNSKSNGKYKISVNDFVIKASALSLMKMPEVNSAWHNSFIRQFKSADISVAVATPAGLITPIVNSAETKGLVSISQKVKELSQRAKDNKLAPNEYQGGSFTISNLGMFGVSQFCGIINPPQSCILAVGTTEKKVIEGEPGQFSTSNVLRATLSCDHRVVDGAVGAQWMQVFKKYLEEPLTMLL